MGTKLNLGSGKKPLEGYINIDNGNVNADINLDLEFTTLPFDDSSIEYVLAENLFVMVQNTKHLLNECWRVLESNGTLNMLNFDVAKHPHLYFQDPEHRSGFTAETYKYFDISQHGYKEFGSVYGYNPWKIKSMEPEGQCWRVLMVPVK